MTNRWPSLEWRFWPKVLPVESGCWEWQAGKDSDGYGQVDAREYGESAAHRVAYAMMVGSPAGFAVLHRCDNPSCVNPAHLWLGTQGENMRDMSAKGRQPNHHNRVKTQCKRGHPFDAVNTYCEANGSRHCRACWKISKAKAKAWEEVA